MYTVPVTAVSEEDEVPVPVPDAEARCPELKENTGTLRYIILFITSENRSLEEFQ